MRLRATHLLVAVTATVGLGRPSYAADRPTTRTATRRAVRTDTLSFDFRPEPPPTPALLYQLSCDPAERRPGTGAADYLQAAVLLTDAEQTLIDQAREADYANDALVFDKAVGELFGNRQVSTILDLLDDASRRDVPGLDAAWRDAGIDAVIPQLSPMRGLANLLYVRARQQTRAGDVAGAVGTLRMGYALAQAVGDGPLICGMVGVGQAAITDEALVKLLAAPERPNLYWALATLPKPIVSFQLSMEAERRIQVGSAPALIAARTADAGPGDWLDMQGWAEALRRGPGHSAPPTAPPAAMAAAAKNFFAGHPEVAAYYARRHHAALADAAKVDPQVVLGTYFLGRFQDASDEFYKLLGEPYPVLIPRVKNLAETLRKEGLEAGNLWAMTVPAFSRSIESFARGDRTRAALTAVEALRSYAAAHDGHLPAALADVTDTPVPDNPVTGRPFEYRLESGTATLADHDPLLADRPLEYTIRIRKP